MNKKEKKKLHSSELKLPNLKYTIPTETKQYEIQLDRCEQCQYSPMCYIQNSTVNTQIYDTKIKIPCPFFKHYEPFQEVDVDINRDFNPLIDIHANEDDEALKKRLERINECPEKFESKETNNE